MPDDLISAEHEDEGVSWSTELHQEPVLGDSCRMFIDRPRHAGSLVAVARPDAAAIYLVDGDERVSFAQHERAVAAVRRELEARGIGPGDRVLVLGRNSIELVVTFWATLRSGAIAALGNAWWSEAEVAHAVNMIQPSIVICDTRRAQVLPARIPMISYDELAALRRSAPNGHDGLPAARREDDPAVIIFTSGTTGFAKAATLSHRGVIATLQSLLLVTKRLPPQPGTGSSSLLSLPLFHIGGLQQVLTAIATGGRLVFNPGRFDAVSAIELINREAVSVWSAVPTMVSRVLDELERGGGDLPSLRTIGIGGSPVPEALRDRVRTALPAARFRVGVTWGLTEAGGVVSTGAGEGIERRPGSVGQLLPTAEARVQDPNEDGVGDLLVRSPSLMLGFWNGSGVVDDPMLTDDADRGRWLNSGDLGWVDDDRYVFVTGRAKDVIIRGGENIASTRVEEEITRHPSVEEVAVVGLPHDDLGEEVGAVVRLRDGADELDPQMHHFLLTRLAHFEVPAHWWVRTDPLPRNATGKILKRELLREFIAHQSEAVTTR